MFINKKQQLSKDILKRGRLSSLLNLEDRITCLKKISYAIKNLSLELKNRELLAFFYFLEDTISIQSTNTENFASSLPRGIVLNIPSSNIPMMPFYTWVPSFFCGNTNFVRLSRKSDIKFISTIISKIDIVLGDLESKRQVFYSDDIDNKITADLSLNCDVRLIWGDNSTIKKIKNDYPTSAVLELSYKNRNSASLINSNEYMEMSISQKRIFLKNYLNDSLSFSFAACSSPQYTFWLGSENNNSQAQKNFIKDLQNYFNKPNIEKGIITTNNLNSLQSFLLNSNNQLFDQYFLVSGRGIVLTEINELKNITDSFLKANSLFVSLRNFEELITSFPKNIQTLTYTNQIDITLIKKIQKVLGYDCPDRIVPIGNALSFNMIWDGTDLLNVLRKKLLIE